jgi:hypothetical protein
MHDAGMPTATLTYTLPDEESEHRAALEGSAARLLLWDIDQHCRSVMKHGDPHPETRRLAEAIRRMIHEADGVTLD